jgi:CRP-like cAMP-binding protein
VVGGDDRSSPNSHRQLQLRNCSTECQCCCAPDALCVPCDRLIITCCLYPCVCRAKQDLKAAQLDKLAGRLKRIEILLDPGTGLFPTDGGFPGGVVINEGDIPGDEPGGPAMYVVESGRLHACKEAVRTDENSDGVVRQYGALEFFGELALQSEDTPRSATVRCIDDTVLLRLAKIDLPDELFNGSSNLDSLRSSYNVTTTMLSYGGPKRYCCGAPGIVIHPDQKFCTYKDIGITMLILYSCTWEPFKAAFAKGEELNNFTDIVVDGIYWWDIAINFITGVRDKNYVELDPKKIAYMYLTGWCIVDVAATFPWDVLASSATGVDENQDYSAATSSSSVQQLALLRLLRLIRILRIIRMGRIVERLSNHFKIRSALIKIVQLVVGLMIVVHLVACLFYMLSYLSAEDPIVYPGYVGPAPTECELGGNSTHPFQGTMITTWVCAKGAGRDQSTNSHAYLLATYFAITTVSTIGYGDISPQLDNDTEVLFTLLVEFFGMFIFSYTVSNMASLLANLNISGKEFGEKVDRYLEWMRDKETPILLRDRVLMYLNLVEASEYIKSADDDSLMASLSVPLQVELRQMIFHDKLMVAFEELEIFRGPTTGKDAKDHKTGKWPRHLPSQILLAEFCEDLAVCVRSVISMENDLIVHRGEPAAGEMFILLKGEVKLVGNDMNRTRTIMHDSPYPFFGLAEILAQSSSEQFESRSVVAMTDCDLARIARDDFEAMLEKFPQVRMDLKAVAKAALVDAASMDRTVTKKALKQAFDEQCSKGAGGDQKRLSKNQLVELLASPTLQCEIAEPMLTRAIDMMDPIGAFQDLSDSTARVDFGNFHEWWSKSNFADPLGFLNSLVFTQIPDETEGEMGWLHIPTAHRVSLHYCEHEVQRGDGAAGYAGDLPTSMSSPQGLGGYESYVDSPDSVSGGSPIDGPRRLRATTSMPDQAKAVRAAAANRHTLCDTTHNTASKPLHNHNSAKRCFFTTDKLLLLPAQVEQLNNTVRDLVQNVTDVDSRVGLLEKQMLGKLESIEALIRSQLGSTAATAAVGKTANVASSAAAGAKTVASISEDADSADSAKIPALINVVDAAMAADAKRGATASAGPDSAGTTKIPAMVKVVDAAMAAATSKEGVEQLTAASSDEPVLPQRELRESRGDAAKVAAEPESQPESEPEPRPKSEPRP